MSDELEQAVTEALKLMKQSRFRGPYSLHTPSGGFLIDEDGRVIYTGNPFADFTAEEKAELVRLASEEAAG